jgi:S1-C subfamily serine protease
MSKIIVYKTSGSLTQIASSIDEITDFFKDTSIAEDDKQRAKPIRVSVAPGATELKKELIKQFSGAVAIILFYEGADSDSYVGSATGIVVNPDGYILTNRHVAAGGTRFIVRLPNQTQQFDMVIHGVDHYHDLALLKPVKPIKANLPYIMFGNSGQVEQGDDVLILGYPLLLSDGVHTDYDAPASVPGSISLIRDAEDTFQLSCSINPGNSGGPLISLINGEVIGVVFAKDRRGEGVGYAIMSRVAQEFLEKMGVH